MALALEGFPGEEGLNILTDSFGAMKLLKSMRRKDFPLELCRHPVRQLRVHVARLLNQHAEAGRTVTTRLIKVRGHPGRGEPLNEAADARSRDEVVF